MALPAYVGADSQPPPLTYQPRRMAFAVGALGCPVAEALIGIGIDSSHPVIHAEVDAQSNLPGKLQAFCPRMTWMLGWSG